MMHGNGAAFRCQAKLLKAMAHPVRLRVIEALLEHPWCVCDLADHLGVRQPYLSQQLAVLRHAGIVRAEKDGLLVRYSPAIPLLEHLLAALHETVESCPDAEEH